MGRTECQHLLSQLQEEANLNDFLLSHGTKIKKIFKKAKTTNIRRKTVNLPTLEDMHISEHAENVYAQINAEEDIGEDYGPKAIIQKRVHTPRQCIF